MARARLARRRLLPSGTSRPRVFHAPVLLRGGLPPASRRGTFRGSTGALSRPGLPGDRLAAGRLAGDGRARFGAFLRPVPAVLFRRVFLHETRFYLRRVKIRREWMRSNRRSIRARKSSVRAPNGCVSSWRSFDRRAPRRHASGAKRRAPTTPDRRRCSSGTASTPCLDPGAPSSSSRRSRRTGCNDGGAPGRRTRHRDRRSVRPRGHGRRQRRDRSRAAPTSRSRSRSTSRAQEIALAEPPRRASISSTRAARSCRCRPRSSRPRSLRPHLLQPGAHVRRSGIPQIAVGHGLLHGRRRATCPRCPTRRSSSRHRDDLSRRAAAREGGDRRGSHGRGARRRRRPHAAVGRRRSTSPKTTRTRSQIVRARSSRTLNTPQTLPGRHDHAGGSAAYDPRRSTASCTRDIAQTATTCARSSRASSTARASTSSRQRYGATLVTGFARLHGFLVGIVANNGVLFSESALKGDALHRAVQPARRSRSSSCRTSPGSWSDGNTSGRGIAKDGAKMVHAVANASVPKFTVVIGGSFGAGNYAMCVAAPAEPRFR